MCSSDFDYVSITKKCGRDCNKESYSILSGALVLITSTPFSDNEIRTDEYCLPKSQNHQYTLQFSDSSLESWSSSSWLSVSGMYGNCVFKNYMTGREEELFTISLHYSIQKDEDWRRYNSGSSIMSEWTSASFDDHDWLLVTLGTSSTPISYTQYYRKSFPGLADMAAYESQFFYQYGIVAYINGVEFYRDHMPDGPVAPSTSSLGVYLEKEYHGVIRPGSEIALVLNMLAVELHFPQYSGAMAPEFNAFMALLASSTPVKDEANCFIYPYPITLTSYGTNVDAIFDFDRSSSFSSSYLPTSVFYALEGARAHINGLRIWPSSSSTHAPRSFSWDGRLHDYGSFNAVFSISDACYEQERHSTFYGYLDSQPYSSFRLVINSAVDSPSVKGFEVQPVTCHFLLPPAIEFLPPFSMLYAHYEELSIVPTLQEFTNCTITPLLPSGLSFDAVTCSVSGISSISLPMTVFTVSSHIDGLSFSGNFTLEVIECTGVFTEVLRIYKGDAMGEVFSLKDLASQQVLLSIAQNTSQVDNEIWREFLCLDYPRVEVIVDGASSYWQTGSVLLLRAMLNTDEYEPIARIHYDAVAGTNHRVVTLHWSVSPRSDWQYWMGDVPQDWATSSNSPSNWSSNSPSNWSSNSPSNWSSNSPSNWPSARMGSFPDSTNQIQLYRTAFDVASLEGVSGVVISLRFLYGCVVTLNGVEVFRHGVVGSLSSSSVASAAYPELRYRHISLPVKMIPTDTELEVLYLQLGSNTLAIAVVAQSASQTVSLFDATVRVMGAAEVSRLVDFSVSSSGVSGDASCAADEVSECVMKSDSCDSNYWQVTFDDDRHEWISSIALSLHHLQGDRQPHQFVVKGRNVDSEAWTTLKAVTSLSWLAMGEKKKIWLENNHSWNQYRIENLAGGGSSCSWQLSGIDLVSDALLIQVPDLAYPTPVAVHRDARMEPLYPNSAYYYDFSILPPLPEGLSMDGTTGILSGSTHVLLSPTFFMINAKRVGGGVSTTILRLSIEACTGTQSLIALTARLDDSPFEGSYRLFAGKGTAGSVVSSVDAFFVSNGLNYEDWCLPHALYTLQLIDTPKNGWVNPAGWWLSVDRGEMIFEVGQMPPAVESVTTVFSSFLPFQVEYDDWRLFNSAEAEVAANWNAVDFDDAAWSTVKAADMGSHNGVTAYVRREVSIPSLEDYAVLNVRVKYVGGVVAYFNGNIVARFNLAEEFDTNTEALTTHDFTTFSKFHVILSTAGAVAGKNVMAFEIHRASGQSAIVFDATGVFGVNECSVVVDSFSLIEASEVSGCTKEELLDLNPSSYGSLANEVGSFLAWTVENLEGSKFNSFAMQTSTAVTSFSFSLFSRFTPEDRYTRGLAVESQPVRDRRRSSWRTTVALAGFRQFRFETAAATTEPVGVNAVVMQFCAAGVGACPGAGLFAPVNEGEISPSACPAFFHGYAYRECSGGILGDVRTEHCFYDAPAHLAYNQTEYVFEIDVEGTTGVPAVKNIVFSFSITAETPLPRGLFLNNITGEISGIPTVLFPAQQFTLHATNPSGSTASVLRLSVQRTDCQEWKACEAKTLSCAFVEDSTLSQFICRGGKWLLVSSCHTALYDSLYETRLTAQFFAVPKESMLEYAIADGALPDGLMLDNSTGIIAGIPTALGSFNVTIATRSKKCLSTTYFIRFVVRQSLLLSFGLACLYVVVALFALCIIGTVILRLHRKKQRELRKTRIHPPSNRV